MDSGSAPTPPDPTVVAAAQGGANDASARLATTLNRADQITPYGKQTWTQGADTRVFDQAGYDAAMAKYNAGANSATTTPIGTPLDPDQASSGGSMAGTITQPGTAPNRDDFYSGGTNGTDHWTSTITLDPRVQQLVDSDLGNSLGLQGLTKDALGRVTSALSSGINYGALPAAGSAAGAQADARSQFTNIKPQIQGAQGLLGQSQGLMGSQMGRLQQLLSEALPTADDATRQRVEDALYARSTSRLDPQFSAAEQQERSILMNRGIPEGSEAWKTEMDNFARGRNDAYSTAREDAIKAGGVEQQRLFDMANARRDQGLQESQGVGQINSGLTNDLSNLVAQETTQNQAVQNVASSMFGMQNTQHQNALSEEERKRSQVLNELASLRSGSQVPTPQFGATPSGATVVPAPIAKSVYDSAGIAQSNYNADTSSSNATTAGIGTVIAAALPYLAALSDRRLKTNIQRIGTHPLGIGWYSYSYIWGEKAEGVMADEVRAVRPSAVHRLPCGYDAVNYADLGV